jgi:hypothetical protein
VIPTSKRQPCAFRDPCTKAVRDRAGWRDGDRYLFTRAGLTEAVGDFDLKAAVNVLGACGALEPHAANRPAQSRWTGGKRTRVYVINPECLDGGGDGS